jgi:TetR/AcrR family transcriptional regulator
VSKPISAAPVLEAHKRERRKEARPGELLEAALDLFVEKGYAAVRENLARTVSEGASELEVFDGPTGELLTHMMQQWWARYGATKASGISKLIISEASNFPELARFYQEEVVVPGTELVRRVLQRGIDRGEFRSGRSAPHRARHHGPT